MSGGWKPPAQAAGPPATSQKFEEARTAFKAGAGLNFASLINVNKQPRSTGGGWRATLGQGLSSLDSYEAPTPEELKAPGAMPRVLSSDQVVRVQVPSTPSTDMVARAKMPYSPSSDQVVRSKMVAAPSSDRVAAARSPLAPAPGPASPQPGPIPSVPSSGGGWKPPANPIPVSTSRTSQPSPVPPLRVAASPSGLRHPRPSTPEQQSSPASPAALDLASFAVGRSPDVKGPLFSSAVLKAPSPEPEQLLPELDLRRRAMSEPSFPSWECIHVLATKDAEKFLPLPSGRSDDSGSSHRSYSFSADLSSDAASEHSDSELSPRENLTVEGSLLLGDDETGGRSIVAGTTERLVQLLADENAPDKNFMDVMLKTHFYFLDSLKLLQMLWDKFHSKESLPAASSPSPSPSSPSLLPSTSHSSLQAQARSSDPTRTPSPSVPAASAAGADKHVYIQIRVINVLKHWIESEPEDFEEPALRQALTVHLERLKSGGEKYERWAQHLTALLAAKRVSPPKPMPKPLLPKRMADKNFNGDVSFLDIHPLELARQMTLMEFAEFAAIRKKEYFRKAWAKNQSALPCPNINASIARFNKTSYWIATEILLTPSPKQRITVLSRFIELAKHLEELNNFNGVMEVLSGLNFSFIKRLKTVWKQVPSKLVKIVKRLDDLMDQASNYRNYRQALASRPAPILPFQGVYLTDLTFIEEKPDRLPNGMVNYEKMTLVYKVLGDIQKHQQAPFNFERVECIQEFLKNPGLVLNDEQLWSHSKKCEPSVEAPLSQPQAPPLVLPRQPYASTTDFLAEKERTQGKLQREPSDRSLATTKLKKAEKKDKSPLKVHKKRHSGVVAVASGLSAVTNILAVSPASSPVLPAPRSRTSSMQQDAPPALSSSSSPTPSTTVSPRSELKRSPDTKNPFPPAAAGARSGSPLGTPTDRRTPAAVLESSGELSSDSSHSTTRKREKDKEKEHRRKEKEREKEERDRDSPPLTERSTGSDSAASADTRHASRHERKGK